MGTISASAFRRVYLLYLLGTFKRGAYGLKRVHKVAYIPARESGAIRPFEFKRYHFGQYSESLDDIKDQLESMGFVVALPLDTALIIELADKQYALGGNRFMVTNPSEVEYYRRVLAALSQDLPRSIDDAVSQYGYLPEADLIKLCYGFPEFQTLAHGDVIFEANLPDRIEVDLSDDECDDLELSLRPELVVQMLRLTDVLDHVDIDWDKVRHVERLPLPRS
jgi:hypothetical protein